MNEERLLSVLLAPHVSEKASVSSHGYPQYVFKVTKDANKFVIKDAVEHLFNVTVRNVRICNVKGKSRRFGRIMGRRKDWKKAYVTLQSGQEIDVAGVTA